MENLVKEFIESNELLVKTDKVLIAVSGGRDSIVLLYILKKLGYNCQVAHCNYGLRGEESEKDAEFVKSFCETINIPFHAKRFQTKELAEKEGVSIQMIARDLRYDWFEELKEKENLNKICTAHHLDDQLETILINLTRGTGIKGLRGMKEKRGDIVRPLLCVERDQINDYLFEKKIPFREDSSNASGKYFRNKIRHQIIPVLKEINPSLFKAVSNTTKRLRGVEDKWEQEFQNWKGELLENEGKVSIPFHLSDVDSVSFLQQFLRGKGFSYPDIDQVLASKSAISGKKFYGKENWVLITANEKFELYQQKELDNNEYYLNEELPIPLTIKLEKGPVDFDFNENRAYLNADKVQGKLKLRKWRKGDWFVPFGMKGKQKLSDFFVNNKFSLEDKEKVWLLCDGEKVVWIIGYRIDNRYKVDDSTKNVYIVAVN